MGEEYERISVSREALRADLAQLELRLTEKLASKAYVDILATNLAKLEIDSVSRLGIIDYLKISTVDLDTRLLKLEAPNMEQIIIEFRELQKTVADNDKYIKATSFLGEWKRWFFGGIGLSIVLISVQFIVKALDLI